MVTIQQRGWVGGISWHIAIALPTPALPLRGSFDPPMQLASPNSLLSIQNKAIIQPFSAPIQGDGCVSLNTRKASHGFHTAERICDEQE